MAVDDTKIAEAGEAMEGLELGKDKIPEDEDVVTSTLVSDADFYPYRGG